MTKCTLVDREQWRHVTVPVYILDTALPFALIRANFVIRKSDLNVLLYTLLLIKYTFVYTVCNNVPKQCVPLLYTYNVNSEENGVAVILGKCCFFSKR